MKIEVLFPEVCNLFGDAMNIEYLIRALPEAELVQTSLKSRPLLADEAPALVYMGSMTESAQALTAAALAPYRERIGELIEGGRIFLITGNALELFGRYIENEDGSRVETLGLFDFYAKRDMARRYNSIYLGKFEDGSGGMTPPLQIDVVGFKSQFSHAYGEENVSPLFHTLRGAGRRPGDTLEGFRKNNFLATYVLGPLLPLNPPLTRWLLELLQDSPPAQGLPFEDAAMAAYDLRLREFRDPRTGEGY